MFTSVSYMLGKEGEGGKTIYFVAFIPMRTTDHEGVEQQVLLGTQNLFMRHLSMLSRFH